MDLWLFWLLLAIVAAIGELVTTGFFLASTAVAGIITAAVALVMPFPIQLVVFGVLTLLTVAVIRPVVWRGLGMERAHPSMVALAPPSIVYKRATVTRTVDWSGGQIGFEGGEFWSARALNSQDVMPPGTAVRVELIEGVTALVVPINASIEADPLSPNAVQKGTYS